VGQNYGMIQNCYNAGSISNTSSGDDTVTGGIVGKNSDDGTIQNCYNIGNISATGASTQAGSIIES
jgi:hypothetical protein